ncbi:MAG: hypothetical protein ACK5YI_12530 [Rhodospirillales bacterium]|jgi:hypothetical protein
MVATAPASSATPGRIDGDADGAVPGRLSGGHHRPPRRRDGLRQRWTVPMMVENRPGASGDKRREGRVRVVFVLFDRLDRRALGPCGSRSVPTPNFDRPLVAS